MPQCETEGVNAVEIHLIKREIEKLRAREIARESERERERERDKERAREREQERESK